MWNCGANAEPDSLPGILVASVTRYGPWMRKNRESIARLWRVGEPVATTASAIAGVDQVSTEEDIAHTADSILPALYGDFAVALNVPPPLPTWKLHWDSHRVGRRN